MSLLSKCGYFALLSVALFISLFAYSSDASAAYQPLKVTDEVIWQVPESFNSCTPSKYTYRENWSDLINGLNDDIPQQKNMKESFWRAVNGTGQWAVIQVNNINDKADWRGVRIVWSETPKTVIFDDPNIVVDGIKNAFFYPGGTSCEPSAFVNSSDTFVYLNDYNGMEHKILLSNFNITYPSDYSGPQLPDSLKTVQQIRPDFKYSVMTKTLDAQHIKNLKELPTKKGEDYVVDWALFKCQTHDPVAYTCEESKLVKQQSLAPGESFKYEVDKYSWYKLDAQYLSGGCHRYDSYPATPDYCWYEKPANTDEYEYIATTVFLDINGEMISGSTAGDDCSNGFCKPPSEFEDCSAYGIGELFKLITCHVNNFFVSLKNFFNMLFLPNGRQLEPIFDRFTSFINTKFGFLATSVVMIKDFTAQLTQPRSGECNFKVANSGAFGRPEPLYLNFCYFPNNFPIQTDILLSMIRAITAMSFVAMIYTRYNALMKGE